MSAGVAGTVGYRPGYEIAAERIIELIVERDLAPGDRLPTEQNLADQLGVSRSVTREAIKVLAAIGRVSAQRGRGLYVGRGTAASSGSLLAGHRFVPGRIEQVEQLLEFRLVQEVYSAGQAARKATPPVLNLLDEAITDAARALEDDDRSLWADADTRFHLAIAQASGNEFIRSALEGVRQLQEQVVVLALHGGSGGSLRTAHDEHVAILAAIRAGDATAASEASRLHLQHTIEGYREEIASLVAAPGR
ncbi:FadR family transcriptional regulator [Plantibacter flavus]|uniref:FadR/GntR family transcriptional regulator n=1 Tax=Plantibacter flavus TaxID=150123 RepID=UPI003F1882FA